MMKNLTPLWCKSAENKIVHDSGYLSAINGSIEFRSFDLDTDLATVHDWVNKDYSRTFWQMRGSLGLLRSCYQCIIQNPFAHSFIGLYNGSTICQFDLYKVSADEISHHVPYEEQDCGFHLLMAPMQKPVHGLTPMIIKTFLEYYFSCPSTGSMFAEPDVTNNKSITLLEKSGFVRIKTIEMSYKKAYVYSLTRNQFKCKG